MRIPFTQKKHGLEDTPVEEARIEDKRLAPGASATGSNVGPNKLPAIDDEAIDPMLP